MAHVPHSYGCQSSRGQHSMNAPRPEETRTHSEKASARNLVRAATEESEELVHHDSNKPNAMLPPPFQRPIPTKPDGYNLYHHTNAQSGQQQSPTGHHRQSSGHHHSVQSVITSSFSIEDGSYPHDRGFSQVERRSDGRSDTSADRKFSRSNSDPMERREPPPHFVVAGSPNSRQEQGPSLRRAFSSLSRSFSSGSDYYNPSMKRSFFHHAKSNNHSPTHVPPEFVPPKRNKVEPPPRKEVTIQPRYPPSRGSSGWCHRKQSWESREDEATMDNDSPITEFNAAGPQNNWYRQNSSAVAAPGAVIHRPAARLPPINTSHPPYPPAEHESPPSYWSQGHAAGWSGTYPPNHESRHFWGSPSNHGWPQPQHRDDIESARNGQEVRDGYRHGPDYREGYDGAQHRDEAMPSNRDQIFRSPHVVMSNRPGDKMNLVVEAASFADSVQNKNQDKDAKPLLLLALPQDRVALSETLCVVRENIEVFTATQSDVDAPAPGRKHAVVVGQVGLRCIHCRHTTRASDRVKRAVCYPSSIKRIYRTVIDMKLDHFSQCKFVPKALTERLNELKAVHTRSTGTTMQYFIKAAHMLGMEDGSSGVRLNLSKKEDLSSPSATKAVSNMSKKKAPAPATRTESFSADSSSSSAMDISPPQGQDSMASASFESTMASEPFDVSGTYFEGNIPLSLPEDKTALSPLRCFLREQVCAFSATEEDIAVRAPTTFSITVGQVGIGCVHCVKQPPKYRSNRAVCFPFSIGRIYQSVADIQRFHLGECKMLPKDVKEAFLSLQSASSKGSKGLATRQYWIASARKLGLVDTQRGIRFGRDPSQPQQTKSLFLDILAQAAFSVTTTNKKLVLPEDRDTIADFLYVVMEQLQPCRFTEADRNKRRVRDVGCIGVECKHCAGQVDSRKFFWSSVSAVESNFVSVHTHMLECRMVPDELKEKLIELKKLRKEQTSQLMTGSQKAFFRRVWERLHREEIVAPESPASTREPMQEDFPTESVPHITREKPTTQKDLHVGLEPVPEVQVVHGTASPQYPVEAAEHGSSPEHSGDNNVPDRCDQDEPSKRMAQESESATYEHEVDGNNSEPMVPEDSSEDRHPEDDGGRERSQSEFQNSEDRSSEKIQTMQV